MPARPRVRGRFVVALVAAILLGIAALVLPSGDEGVSVPSLSPVKVQLTTNWLRTLLLPAGVRRDRTATACWLPTPLCVTAAASPQALLARLRTALHAHGGSVGSVHCVRLQTPSPDLPDLLSGLPTCSLSVSYRGATVGFLAGDRYAFRRAPATWADATIVGAPDSAIKPQPLPALRTLGAIPRAWHVSAPCVRRLHGGCNRYDGRFSLPSSLHVATRAWLRTLLASGYRVDRAGCYTPPREHCILSATRNLSDDGGRPLLLIVDLKPTGDPNRTRGRLDIVADTADGFGLPRRTPAHGTRK